MPKSNKPTKLVTVPEMRIDLWTKIKIESIKRQCHISEVVNDVVEKGLKEVEK